MQPYGVLALLKTSVHETAGEADLQTRLIELWTLTNLSQ